MKIGIFLSGILSSVYTYTRPVYPWYGNS